MGKHSKLDSDMLYMKCALQEAGQCMVYSTFIIAKFRSPFTTNNLSI